MKKTIKQLANHITIAIMVAKFIKCNRDHDFGCHGNIKMIIV